MGGHALHLVSVGPMPIGAIAKVLKPMQQTIDASFMPFATTSCWHSTRIQFEQNVSCEDHTRGTNFANDRSECFGLIQCQPSSDARGPRSVNRFRHAKAL